MKARVMYGYFNGQRVRVVTTGRGNTPHIEILRPDSLGEMRWVPMSGGRDYEVLYELLWEHSKEVEKKTPEAQ